MIFHIFIAIKKNKGCWVKINCLLHDCWGRAKLNLLSTNKSFMQFICISSYVILSNWCITDLQKCSAKVTYWVNNLETFACGYCNFLSLSLYLGVSECLMLLSWCFTLNTIIIILKVSVGLAFTSLYTNTPLRSAESKTMNKYLHDKQIEVTLFSHDYHHYT